MIARSTLTTLLILFVPGLLIGCGGTSRVVLPPGADQPNVVAVIDQDLLTLDEFEERYARTAGGREAAADDSLGAYRDFLERYVNFRLKVLAAEEAGLNNDPEILEEIATYRTNLARPYLIDREVLDPLVREMFDRRQELIDASHILIRVARDASPEDTLAAYNKLAAILDSARSGVDFGALAERHSEDPSARRPGPGYQGELGYFTAGRMVDEFEEAAYATPVGEISPIIRTNFGYHILRVNDRRPNEPARTVAHIMVVPTSDSAAAKAAAMDTIRVIQARLATGVGFDALAQQYSGDRRSAAQGGQLPPISRQTRLPESFLSAVFALQTEGQVSDVVETQYGYHLIKLLDKGQLPTYEEAYEDLKQEVARLPRADRATDRFARELWESYAGTIDTATVLQATAPYETDSLLAMAAEDSLPAEVASVQFAQLADSTYTLANLLDHAQRRGIPGNQSREEALKSAIGAFARDAALAYETAALETRNEEFARVMQEFRDGLVLFSLMEDSVWTAASEDSVALRAHYDAHKESYRFPERTRVVALYSASDSLLKDVASKLDAGSARGEVISGLLADSTVTVRVDTVRIAEQTNSIFDQALGLAEGAHVGPTQHNREWVLLLNDGSEAPRLKTFEEARATVVSEYQELVEADLINRLRARYEVHLFPERLTAAFAESTTASGSAATSQ
ncbi:MAG TPA: peptidylprolyl isomerase [Rhodothermales bacterium]